jgi:hypothetical protein
MDKTTPLPRRTFLLQGIGVSSLLLISKKLSFSFLERFTKIVGTDMDSKDDVLPAIVRRYGSEFGDLKPLGRRSDYGRV